MSPILRRLGPLSSEADGGLPITETSKAGVLVFYKSMNGVEILLLHRSRQNDWSFPKGHVEAGEGVMEAALRETREESGVTPFLLGRLRDLTYLDSKQRPVRLALFLGVVSHKDDVQPVSPEGERAEWVPLAEVQHTLSYENLRFYFREFVLPLFQGDEIKRLSVGLFFSKNEPYINGVTRLKDTLAAEQVRGREVEIHEKVSSREKSNFFISYFLTNETEKQVGRRRLARASDSFLINAAFFKLMPSKSGVQTLLREWGIPVPESSVHLDAKMTRAQWMVKSEYHDHPARGIYFFLRWIRPSDKVYFEKKIDKRSYVEQKIGYVSGQLFVENERLLSQRLRSMHHRIQEHLGLDVFSTDVFFSKKNNEDFFIVDVNHAPAFFQNRKARRGFAEYLKALSAVWFGPTSPAA